MAQLFANAARTTLTASITAASTQLQINPADQGLFPVASGLDWFKVAIEDSSGNIEYIKVQRAVGASLLTVMSGGRAVEDSARFPARSFSAGSLVELRMTAADLALTIAHPNINTNAHAASAIAFAPAKSLASTNLQAAIEELLTEGGLDTLALQGDVPQITFDAGDYLQFKRDTNLLNVVIGGAGRFYVDASGPARETDATTANGLVRKAQLDAVMAAGDTKFSYQTADHGRWLMVTGPQRTIGNAGSGATARANEDTLALYTLLWSLDAADVAIYTSTGAASTRGASAAADFAALKRIDLPNESGLVSKGHHGGNGALTTNTTRRLGSVEMDEVKRHKHQAWTWNGTGDGERDSDYQAGRTEYLRDTTEVGGDENLVRNRSKNVFIFF